MVTGQLSTHQVFGFPLHCVIVSFTSIVKFILQFWFFYVTVSGFIFILFYFIYLFFKNSFLDFTILHSRG